MYLPLSEQLSVLPNQKDFSIDTSLFVEIPSSKLLIPPYYISILLNDDSDIYRKYHKVNLVSYPIEFEGYILITQPSENEIEIQRYSSKKINTVNKKLFGNYSLSVVDNINNMCIINESKTNKTYALSTNDLDIKWQLDAQLPYPEIHQMNVDNNLIYISSDIGRLFGVLSSDGTTKFITDVMPDTIPINIGISDDYIINDYSLRNPGSNGWQSYYRTTGEKLSRYSHNFETKGIFTENNQAIIFCNGDPSFIFYFDIMQNKIISEIELHNTKFDRIFKISEWEYGFSYGNKIFIVNIKNSSLRLLHELSSPVIDIKYEHLSQRIIVASGNYIHSLSYDGQNTDSLLQVNNLNAIELVYNR